MFSKLALFAVASFAVFVTALPQPTWGGSSNDINNGQCNQGAAPQCCNSVQDSQSAAVQSAAAPLGIPISVLHGPVGLECSPIVGALAGSNCNQQAVCCSGNQFGGLISLGCMPINVGA